MLARSSFFAAGVRNVSPLALLLNRASGILYTPHNAGPVTL